DLGDLTDVLPPRSLPCDERQLTVVVQRPFEGEAVARLLSAVYPGTRCSDFIEPENPYTALVSCDIPRDAQTRSLTMTLEARYWISKEPAKEPESAPSLVRSEPFLGYVVVPAPFYDEKGSFYHAEWTGTVNVTEAADY